MRWLLKFSPPCRVARQAADLRWARCAMLSGVLLFALLLSVTLPVRAQHSVQAKGAQDAKKGQTLFVKNCSPCHGAQAQGGEGPNLHGLHLSSPQIAATIKNGIKGEMPAFGKKFKAGEIKQLVAFLQSLKK